MNEVLGKEITIHDILTQVEVNNWQEGVRIAGEILYKNGKVKKEYIEGMIRTIEELGAYAVIAPGVALPHARPEDGALKVGFSVVILKSPVNFGSPNDPVKIIIAFSAPDKTSHLRTLQELALLLSDEEFRAKLMSAKTPEDVIELIKEYSKKK